MTTKTITEAQGWLKIDGPASLRLGSEGGSFEGLLTDISAKSVAAEFSHREADPIDGDAVTKRQRSEWSASFDHQTAGPPLQSSDGLNQSCEHASLARAMASGHNRTGPTHRHG